MVVFIDDAFFVVRVGSPACGINRYSIKIKYTNFKQKNTCTCIGGTCTNIKYLFVQKHILSIRNIKLEILCYTIKTNELK